MYNKNGNLIKKISTIDSTNESFSNGIGQSRENCFPPFEGPFVGSTQLRLGGMGNPLSPKGRRDGGTGLQLSLLFQRESSFTKKEKENDRGDESSPFNWSSSSSTFLTWNVKKKRRKKKNVSIFVALWLCLRRRGY